jgi:hypothetical protein
VRCAQPLRNNSVADLCPDRAPARDAENRLGRGVELENDPLIVSGDDTIEGTLENPAKAPIAVAQRRDRLVMRDRDPDQPRGPTQGFNVERLPGAFLDAIVKTDGPPPSAAGALSG